MPLAFKIISERHEKLNKTQAYLEHSRRSYENSTFS